MKDDTIPFWAKFEFHSTEAQKMKEEKMEESLGLGKSYDTKTNIETWSWFCLPILKPGFGCMYISLDSWIKEWS